MAGADVVTVNLRPFKGAPQPSFDAHGLRAYKNAPARVALPPSEARGLRAYKNAPAMATLPPSDARGLRAYKGASRD
jgi:hypothetical protein